MAKMLLTLQPFPACLGPTYQARVPRGPLLLQVSFPSSEAGLWLGWELQGLREQSSCGTGHIAKTRRAIGPCGGDPSRQTRLPKTS